MKKKDERPDTALMFRAIVEEISRLPDEDLAELVRTVGNLKAPHTRATPAGAAAQVTAEANAAPKPHATGAAPSDRTLALFDAYSAAMAERQQRATAERTLQIGPDLHGASILLARIAALYAAGSRPLPDSIAKTLVNRIHRAYEANIGPVTEALLQGTVRPEWAPSEKWRETDPKETAAAYFERVIAPIPFASRPSTTKLAEIQPDLYRSLKYLCYDQKRFKRTGPGEIGRASRLTDVLPMGTPKHRTREPS